MVNGATTTTYSIDNDGFLTSKTDGTNTTSYSYARTGELLSVTLPDTTLIEYVHDASGQRIAKKVGGVIVEKYLWASLTGLLAVYDGSDNLVARFEYADDRMPLKMVQGGTTYYLTYDQVGSLRAVLDATGTVVHQITYDSYGNILTETASTLTLPFGFAGGLHDRDTGLVRFGFRDYDPDVGRWTAKDPIGFVGGDINLYNYCSNNPVNQFDPTGLDPLPADVQSALGAYFPDLDLSTVEVHMGIPPIVSENAAITPAAVTIYDEIFFAPDYYKPYTSEGLALIGHELVHVEQIKDSSGLINFLLFDYLPNYFYNMWLEGMSADEAYRNLGAEKEGQEMQQRILDDIKDGTLVWPPELKRPPKKSDKNDQKEGKLKL